MTTLTALDGNSLDFSARGLKLYFAYHEMTPIYTLLCLVTSIMHARSALRIGSLSLVIYFITLTAISWFNDFMIIPL